MQFLEKLKQKINPKEPMAYDKKYYDEKRKKLEDEGTNAVRKLVQDVYAFVRVNESVGQRIGELAGQEKDSFNRTFKLAEEEDLKVTPKENEGTDMGEFRTY